LKNASKVNTRTTKNIPEPIADQTIDDFSYELPANRIAEHPLADRDSSKLLVVRKDELENSNFRALPGFLPEKGLMVLNNTRVIQARLEFFKETGARIEIFCLNPVSPETELTLALQQKGSAIWRCLLGNAKKWKQGKLTIENSKTGFELQARIIATYEGEYDIEFLWAPENINFAEILEMSGKTPLPPYITRQAVDSDKVTYQTVYAQNNGSVAAPTAGLHFTPRVFDELEKRGIDRDFVTLHVGAGTFKPVSSSTIGEHDMHGEQFVVKKEFIKNLIKYLGKITSVGTTSMRTLESLYWIGLGILDGNPPKKGFAQVDQWEPYIQESRVETKDALAAIVEYLEEQKLESLQGETSLIIVPGYEFKVVDCLVTNFHQPRSTLLCLVAAFAGPGWKKAYDFALQNNYRFLSYGDSCLFFKQNSN